jgi:hypothetical protein
MNTKEAIEFLDYIHTIADEDYNEDSVKKKDEVIALLKRCDNCAYVKLVNKFIIETGDFK